MPNANGATERQKCLFGAAQMTMSTNGGWRQADTCAMPRQGPTTERQKQATEPPTAWYVCASIAYGVRRRLALIFTERIGPQSGQSYW